MASVPDQSYEFSVFDDDDGSASLIFFTILIFEGLTVQLEYFNHSILG